MATAVRGRPTKETSELWETAENLRAMTDELEEAFTRLKDINRGLLRWAKSNDYPFLDREET